MIAAKPKKASLLEKLRAAGNGQGTWLDKLSEADRADMLALQAEWRSGACASSIRAILRELTAHCGRKVVSLSCLSEFLGPKGKPEQEGVDHGRSCKKR